MSAKLNLLVIGPDSELRILITGSLQDQDCRIESADADDGLSRALARGGWDAFAIVCARGDGSVAAVVDCLRTVVPARPVIVVVATADEASMAMLRRLNIDDLLVADQLARPGDMLLRSIEHCRARDELCVLRGALQESEARLQHVLAGGAVAVVWEIDAQSGRVSEWGAADRLFARPSGYRHGTVDDLISSIHEPDRDWMRARIAETLMSGTAFDVEFRVASESGSLRWIGATGRVERDAAGRALRLHGTASDITARKLADIALHASEAFNRQLLESLVDGVFIAQDYRFVFANPALPAMLGYTHSEFVGLPFERVVAPDHLRIWTERFIRRIGEGEEPPGHYDVQIKDAQGRPLWIELRAGRIKFDQRPAVLGIVRDISDRKRAQDALASSESRANLILDLVPEAMLLVDATGRIVRANRRAGTVLGYSPDEMQGMSVEALIPQRLRAAHGAHMAAFAANPRPRQMGQGRELVALRRDGSEFPVEASIGPAQIDGQPHVIVTLVDISDRKRAAMELQRFEQIVRTSPDMLAYVDYDLRFQVVNPAYAMQFGAQPEELAGKSLREVLRPETWRDIEPFLLRALAGEELRFSSRRVFADGEEHVLDATYRPFVVAGKVIGIVVSHRDVTERVRAEAAAARESRRNQILLRNASDGITILDISGRVVEASDSFCAAIGYAREEVIGASLSLWDARWTEDELGEIFARAIHDGSRRQFETLHRRKDGTTFEVEVTSITVDVDGQPVVFSSTRDISHRRAVERALSESEAVIERAQQMAHLGSWTYDFSNDQVFLSAEHQRILIWPSNICGGAELMALVHPDDAERVAGVWQKCSQTGETIDIEYRVVIKGIIKHLHVRGEMRCDESGRVQSAIGFTQDVTTLREAERTLEAHASRLEEEVAARTAALAAAEAKFRGLVEQSFAAIDIYQDGYFRYVNPAFARIFGYDAPDQVVDRVRGIDLIAPECRERVLENLRLRSTGEVESIQYEFVGLRRDGSRVELEVFGRHFEYDGRPATIGIVIDITQRKLADQAQARALAEAERLAQVRRDFLANMSHEIRTPLSAILGLAQVGMREDVGRRSGHTFGRILDSGQLLLGVINDILDFSKIEAGKLDVEVLPFDLGEAVDRAVGFVAPQAQSKGLNFVVEEAADLPSRCAGDKLRLSQILVNLLSNAVKFTEHGSVRLRITRDAGWLRFEVIDSGIGIPPDQLARLFRPFEQGDTTTTRRFGGTGLGLTISNRLAGLMAGELTAQSRVGEGSTFALRVPLRDAVPAPVPESLRIVLAGLEDRVAADVADALAERGVRAVRLAPLVACAKPADLVVIDGAAFDETVSAQVRQACARGRRVALAGRGDLQRAPDEDLRAGLIQIDYPLRARHLIAAARAPAAAPASVAVVPGGPRLRGVRVLAAEDNAINREVLSEILGLEGAQLTLAEDGEQAVACIQRHGAKAFDVLLTDIQMPGIDGYETAQRVLALAPGLPVMGLTAHAMRDERERCLAAGMVEHIAKPIDIDDLVSAVLRHVRQTVGTPAAAAPAPAATRQITAAADMSQPVIDWAALEKRFAARPAFVARLGQMLLQSQSGTPARLREVATGGDHAQIAFLAHTLKGVAGNLMARPAESLARETEAAAREASPEAVQLAMQLAEALEAMIEAVHLRFPDAEAALALTVGG